MFSVVAKEFSYTLRLSAPITIGLLGQGLFGVIDTLMVGNMLGEHALAAATLANNVNWLPLLLSFGLCSAIPVLTAQARGAGKHAGVPAILRHGLLISVGFSVIGAAISCLFIFGNGLNFLGQPPSVAASARTFSYIIAASIPMAAGFQAVKAFRDATGGQWISLFWMIAGLLTNIFLNWALMSGSLGFPNWGIEGAAAGTFFSRLFSFVGISLHEKLVCDFRAGFSRSEVKKNLAIAVPSSLHILFEAGIFIISPFVMGWISEASIAANQSVMVISSLVYMVPLGVAQALSIRVGEAYGRKNRVKIRMICIGALLFPLALMATFSAAMIIFREQIPLAFNLGTEASALAATFLSIAGAYVLFDAFQTIAAGALRGLGDVRVIALAAFVSYWLVGFPLALILAFPLEFKGAGVWLGLASGLACVALILGVRLFRDIFLLSREKGKNETAKTKTESV